MRYIERYRARRSYSMRAGRHMISHQRAAVMRSECLRAAPRSIISNERACVLPSTRDMPEERCYGVDER